MSDFNLCTLNITIPAVQGFPCPTGKWSRLCGSLSKMPYSQETTGPGMWCSAQPTLEGTLSPWNTHKGWSTVTGSKVWSSHRGSTPAHVSDDSHLCHFTESVTEALWMASQNHPPTPAPCHPCLSNGTPNTATALVNLISCDNFQSGSRPLPDPILLGMAGLIFLKHILQRKEKKVILFTPGSRSLMSLLQHSYSIYRLTSFNTNESFLSVILQDSLLLIQRLHLPIYLMSFLLPALSPHTHSNHPNPNALQSLCFCKCYFPSQSSPNNVSQK